MKFLTITLLAAFTLLANSMQTSVSPAVRLGVREKMGDTYTATFIVTDPTSKTYNITVQGSSANWTYVIFPDDFNTYAKPGTYKWSCYVDGVEIRTCTFKYSTSTSYSDVLTVNQE